MADVRPFRAIRYAAAELEALVSPPYDVISEDALDGYRSRSPHNVIRLIRPGSDYESAARTFEAWLDEGVLVQEESGCMYVHEVQFDGRMRRDLVAAVRLQPYEDGVILPHERTHRGPKEDRLRLLQATGVSLEPLWFTYEGGGTSLPATIAAVASGPPYATFGTDGGELHRLWRLTGSALLQQISRELADRRLLIADGHHRYETTLHYSRGLESRDGRPAASQYTLGLLTDMDDPGLEVLPTHRLLRSGVAVVGGEEAASLEDMLRALDGRVAAGTYRQGRFQVLPLEGEEPVVELHRQVLDNILGERSAEEYLTYTRDPVEAVRWVDEGRGVAAFFLAAPDLHAVLRLAEQGTTMPQKSTYFHPKPPSGMLFHRLDPTAPI